MAAAVDIKIDGLDALTKEFFRLPTANRKAMRRAVSRTVTTGVKNISQFIRKESPLKARTVKKRVIPEKHITGQFPFGEITISGSRLPLFEFQARQTRRGVTYKTRKSGGRLLLRSGVIKPTAARGKQVLRRGSDPDTKSGLVARYPFLIRFGPSAAEIIGDEVLKIEEDLDALLQERYLRELDFFLSKQKSR